MCHIKYIKTTNNYIYMFNLFLIKHTGLIGTPPIRY